MIVPRRFLGCFLLALLLATTPAIATDHIQARFDGRLREAWDSRQDVRGLVALLWADQLRDSVADPAPLFPLAEKLAGAPETQECTRALALNILARERAMEGRLEEADAFNARLGYIGEWSVVGPFPDDSKEGFDAIYPPEEGTYFAGTYEGKGHPVSWRRVPPLRGREVVPMDGMLDPSSKVAGYAASFVRVPKDTPAVLRGGFNEAVKIWVDGELVGARKVYSGRVFDKYSFPCTLRKGWNLILVKLCNQEAGWNFALRLTDAGGKALEGWACTGDPAGVGEGKQALMAKDGAPSKGFAWFDPEAVLKERAQKGAETGAEKGTAAASAADYAHYLAARQPFDRANQDDVRAFEEAVRQDPNNTELLCDLGDYQEDHNLARKAYQSALDKKADDPGALFRMAQYYNRRSMPFPAIEYLDKALAADPGNPALEAFRAQIRLRYVVDGLAGKDLASLGERFPRSEPVQRARGNALRSLGLEDDLLAITSRYRESHQEIPDAWLAEIQSLRSRGMSERADALLQAARQRFPFNLTLVEDEAAYRVGSGFPEKARASLESVLAWAPDWAEGHRLYGDALGALGLEKEALAAYQKSLTLKPQQESLKTKVAFISPEEGGFEVACRIPDSEMPTDLSKYPDERVLILLDNTAVEVQPSGLSSRYVQRVFQVVEQGAVQEFQSFPITYDPDSQEVKILEASILKADGRKVHAESFTTDRLAQPQYRLYYRSRNLILSFPSLAAGDRVRIEYKISDVGDANEYGRYFGYLEGFGENAPVLLKQFTLILPSEFPLHIYSERLPVDPIVLTREGRKTYRWVARNLDRIQPEPDMPGMTEVGSYLHVSTFDDWDAMGRWYAGFIRDQWELTPEIKKLVAELTAGKTSTEDKVRAIHRWVVQQTRYVGLEFGVHGIRPYKVRQIFERRFGDCKDKAILLAAMLREAGVDACMVLIRTRNLGEMAQKPASLAIFNHAICFVPGLDLFLDGTAEYSGLRELPYQDQGVWTLLVWPDGKTERRRTPEAPDSNNRFEARYEITLQKDAQDAPFTGSLTFAGEECSWVRQRYQDPDKHAEALEQDLSGSYPGTKVREAKFSDLKDLDAPVEIRFSGVLGRVARPDGEGRISLPVWMGRSDLTARMASLARRRFDLLNDYPWRQIYQVTYILPAGATADLHSDASIDNEFGSAKRSARKDGEKVTVTLEVSLKVRRVSPERYGEFRDFCNQVDALAGQRLRVSLSGR
jgi:transglutaminase-like putative cysteine protease/predicted Zn-dependent protease